jgi:RHS repeat-associated protein
VRTTTVSNATSLLPAISLSLAGLTTSRTDQHGCTTIYTYDALMRQISAETRSGASNERLTGSYTHFNVIGQVDYTQDAFGTRTVYGYEPGTGRRVSTTQHGRDTDPVLTTYTAYDSANRTLATWGATYPVAYEYGTAGRMIAMYTYRGTAAISSCSDIVSLKPEMDRTQWLYDQATGLLTNKLYADGKGPAYSYTALGQLSTRIWARLGSTGQQLLTQYRYDSFGSLTNTAYSDGTPSVSFTINALGQMKTVTDASGTRTLDYAADGQMLAEALAFNTSLFNLHEKFDNLGRNEGYALSNDVAQITGTMQSYDQYGRLNQVAVDGISGAFTYGYLEGSHLQRTLAMPNGVTRTFGYEANRDLLTMIVHSNATDRLVQRDFTFDGFGRLIDRTLARASGSSSSAPDAFGYNLRSELTNAVIGANTFAYNFDPIGNRNSATEFGTNTSYIASALNQYTSISSSVKSVPLREFNPEFDLDGNQTLLRTTTGIWHVTYNGENRPVLFSNETTKVEMAYDYMGRRFQYKETVNGNVVKHERYLYRVFLQIAALDMLNAANVTHVISWDPTKPMATRPLCITIHSSFAAFFYSFDQIKNVTELFDIQGQIVATYVYSPFGAVAISSEYAEPVNPITFSSEVFDSTLGLQYYNYRHLNLLDGRWVNRDPIEERGGVNCFAFSRNKMQCSSDILGLFGPGDDRTAGHGDMPNDPDCPFDFNLEDTDVDTTPIPIAPAVFSETSDGLQRGGIKIVGNPKGHFEDRKTAEIAIEKATKTCDAKKFERAMHRGQDVSSHSDNGYKWNPLLMWKNLGLGHAFAAIFGDDPDNDPDAFDKASQNTKDWLDAWNRNCCIKDCSDCEWVSREVGPCGKPRKVSKK